ncbi:protoporphyrinogen/coproporphyrinogen oxidase [Propionibacteriaceae bacterium G1746]|uniref:protoporphyrinogen/coproporphyrinogen oxidase n=1 Tax=Aestuariimicrobium sp. G57 TaxID=3418485 RepID=UPI003C28E8A7
MSRCIVIGGGIAGLVAAWQLTRDGIEVDVFESAPLMGGALLAHTVAGLELNSGAEGFATAAPHMFELVDELGLSDRVVYPSTRTSWIINIRGSFPSPVNSYLGIPADPLADDVVAVIGHDAAQHAALDAQLPADYGYRPGVSLGEYVEARMGRAVRALLVEPIVGGVHSTHPDLLELDSIAPRLHPLVRQQGSLQAAVAALRKNAPSSGAAVASLDPVIDLLPRTLAAQAEANGARFYNSMNVRSVRRGRGDGWNIVLDDHIAHADQVVISTPAVVTRDMLSHLPDVAAAIPEVKASPVALVTLVVDDERLDDAPRSNGALVAAHTPGITAKALTHATAKWDHIRRAAEESAPGRHRHVVRLSYGRSGDQLPPRHELPQLALRDAGKILGVPLTEDQVVAVDVTRWGATMTQARPGHQTALKEVAGHLSHHPGLALTGAWIAGTGIAAISAHARAVADHVAGLIPNHPTPAAAVPEDTASQVAIGAETATTTEIAGV